MIEAFKVFDSYGNRYITEVEFKQVILSLDENITDDEVNEMMKEPDKDGDGYINYEEFCRKII